MIAQKSLSRLSAIKGTSIAPATIATGIATAVTLCAATPVEAAE